MQELQLPTRHDWNATEPVYGKIVIEPFEPGFALTVGIAYRRVLLSAIHGAAPTWVKIENVLHEFSHLPGVQEDTLDIMMNLRKVTFALHVNRPKILRLKAQGTRVVKAGDFEPDADVQVLTPDVTLATLDKDGMLEMEVCIERGRGYQPAEKREPEALPINAILLDADFSPVKRVNFHVEPIAGDKTEAPGPERLVLEVWTDGSVAPQAALAQLANPLESAGRTEATRPPPAAAQISPGDLQAIQRELQAFKEQQAATQARIDTLSRQVSVAAGDAAPPIETIPAQASGPPPARYGPARRM